MASALVIPVDFQRSYSGSKDYPRNLIHQTSYPTAVSAYISRLDSDEKRLFVSNASEVDILFGDFRSSSTPQPTPSIPPTAPGVIGQAPEIGQVRSDLDLQRWLGDESTVDPLSQTMIGSLATKKDPKCRFIFIWAENSRMPLKITRPMITRILSYHQVMAGYLDFVSAFGLQSEPRDLRYSGFREQTLLASPALGLKVVDLGRSGRQYQLCYNLKSVSCKPGQTTSLEKKEWSIRQAALHHQFDVVEGTTLWIVTQGRQEIMDRIKDFTGKKGKPEDRACETVEECFKFSLSIHLLIASWSVEEWRWYIQWLETVINRQTSLAVYGPLGEQAEKDYTPADLQNVHSLADKTNEAIMILDANIHILTSLRKYYERLLGSQDFPLRKKCRKDVVLFATRMDDMIYDLNMQVARTKLIVQITNDRKNLVLQHLQSQATAKMEALTVSMWYMGALAQKEAIAMRIITVATLIFLPATFVSTLFSTDVVKYQDQNNFGNNAWGQSFSIIALIRWLEVAAPLTVVTLVLAFIFYRRSNKKRQLELETLPTYTKN